MSAVVWVLIVVSGPPGRGTTWLGVLALPLTTLVGSKLYGLYGRDELVVQKTTLDEAAVVFHLTLALVLLLWSAQALALEAPLRPAAALLFGAALFAFLLLGRSAARAVASRTTPPERCLLIGDDSVRRQLAIALRHDRRNARLVGSVSLGQADTALDSRPISVDGLRQIADECDADRVIIEPGDATTASFHNLVRAAEQLGVRVSVLPRVTDLIRLPAAGQELASLTLFGLPRFGLTRSATILKRAFDVAVGGSLIVLLSPVLAVVSVAIVVDSPGPIVFRQRRVGRHGQVFDILKFRSMAEDADAGKDVLQAFNEAEGLFKIAADPRVTRLGRLLRRACIDELPQLFNVLRGEMSLVGPRPLVLDEDRLITGWDRRRLELRPGMTGPWQIAGGPRIPLGDMVKMDYRYAAAWSVWNDVMILLRTVAYAVRRQGI
jgi:exopolysaccharide biosynthesis polyprenyl glycosylphosphotransferase